MNTTTANEGFLSAVFHGIGAYRGQKNPVALCRALNIALSGVELCGSDRAIGAFGVVLHGHCRAVFDSDVWSAVDEDGARVCNSHGSFLEGADQNVFEDFAKSSKSQYCEAWVCATGLRALWVKSWASDSTIKAAKIMASHRGVPLLILNGDQRIWEVYSELPTTLRITK